MPNLVQTLANNPAFIYGGPFANFAQGRDLVMTAWTKLKLADYLVTEAEFGAGLEAEKFFDIKCRKAGVRPDGAVVPIRALEMCAGPATGDLGRENVETVHSGLANPGRHFNRFTADTDAELDAACEYCGAGRRRVHPLGERERGDRCACAQGHRGDRERRGRLPPLYPDDIGLWEKTETIARDIYGAVEVTVLANLGNQSESRVVLFLSE